MSARLGRLRRFGWFVLIYAASVMALGAVSLLIRWWIG
ncbi:MAG TPA: DUF2474 family protein [Sphingobium sp.]|nr:DUF2474 family protein [Sphingobium sp.]